MLAQDVRVRTHHTCHSIQRSRHEADTNFVPRKQLRHQPRTKRLMSEGFALWSDKTQRFRDYLGQRRTLMSEAPIEMCQNYESISEIQLTLLNMSDKVSACNATHAGNKPGEKKMTDTESKSINCTRRRSKWVGYVVREGFAWEVFDSDSLETCRQMARCSGYFGILIGSPSVPWAN